MTGQISDSDLRDPFDCDPHDPAPALGLLSPQLLVEPNDFTHKAVGAHEVPSDDVGAA